MALTKITTSVVAVNSLTSANIADNSIDATKIANNQILARHIASGSLTDQLGTLTALTVDNIGINGETITLTGSSATGFIQTSTNVLQFGTSTDDPIQIYTNNAERARIDSAGRFAIGVTNPSDYYATNLVVSGASEGGITLASTATNVTNYIMFADGTSGDARYRGYFGYNHNNDSLALAAAGTQRLRVDSDGLKFGSDSAAANALDDYEEGTFTPTFGGATLSTDDGSYTKIGNQVTVHFRVITTGGLPTSSSQVQVGNLPFTIGTGFGGVGGLYVGPSNVSSATGGGGTIVPYVTGGETFIRFLNVDTGTFGYTTWGELEVSHNNVVTAVGTVTYTV